jgi:hypothetical protein
MGKRVALERPRARLLSDPTGRNAEPLGKFFCRQQFEPFRRFFAPQLLLTHFFTLRINDFRCVAVWHTASLADSFRHQLPHGYAKRRSTLLGTLVLGISVRGILLLSRPTFGPCINKKKNLLIRGGWSRAVDFSSTLATRALFLPMARLHSPFARLSSRSLPKTGSSGSTLPRRLRRYIARGTARL